MRHVLVTSSQAGEVLRARRVARRIPQQQIAEELQISQGRLSVLEANAGEIKLERLLRMARVLGFELVLQDARPLPPSEW